MDMYLTAIESGARLQIPLLPDRLNVKTGAQTVSCNIINVGEVKIPRGSNLTGYSWNGIFPGAYMKNANYVAGWQKPHRIISTLESYMRKGTTLQFMVTDLSINVNVFIESFTYDFYGGGGDVSYTINLTVRRALTIQTVPPQPVIPPAEPEPPTTEDPGKKYGTVKLNNKNSHLNVRKKATTSSSILGKLNHGAKVELLSKSGNWYCIPYAKGTNGKAYVYASYIKVITTTNSSGGKITTTAATTTPTTAPASSSSGGGGGNSSTHTVKTGDSLYSIAAAKLGNGGRYPEIYALNQAAIDNKNKGKSCSKYTIYTGMVLKLPAKTPVSGGGGGGVVYATRM